MSQSAFPSELDNGDRTALRNIYQDHHDAVVQMLQLGTFTLDDVDGAGGHDWRQLMRRLKAREVIAVVETVTRDNPDGGSDYIRQWEWIGGARSFLREYHDSSDALPCGHRPHVHHREDGAFGCQYCDQARDYDRETVEELVFA